MLNNKFSPIIYHEGDKGGGDGNNNQNQNNDQNNVTLQTMRKEMETMRKDFDTVRSEKAQLQEKLTNLERAKLDENERLKAELTDLQTKNQELSTSLIDLNALQERLKGRDSFLDKLYNSELEKLPDDKRETIKELSFIKDDPIESLSKLQTSLKILGDFTSSKSGTVTIPPKGSSDKKGASEENTIDLKKLTWGSVLTPMETLIKQRDKLNQTD